MTIQNHACLNAEDDESTRAMEIAIDLVLEKPWIAAVDSFAIGGACMSTYAREQARCLYSPALIDNLERNWDAGNRTPK